MVNVPRSRSSGKKVVATYDYKDEHGKYLFTVERTEPKGFRQCIRRPGKRTQWQLGNVRRVPYRLPELVAARDDPFFAGVVYVVEGEKDVHTLVDRGFVATTNPMGAGKWKDEWAEFFTGLDVCVVADGDQKGRKHARKVYDSLAGVAASRKIVAATAGNDVTEHLEADHALTDLVDVTQALQADTSPNGQAPVAEPRQAGWTADALAQVALDRLFAPAGNHAGREDTAYWFARQMRDLNDWALAEQAMRIYWEHTPPVNSEGDEEEYPWEKALATLHSARDNVNDEWTPGIGPFTHPPEGQSGDIVARFREACLDTDAVKALVPAPKLIGGYLYQDSLARIYGPAGSSKTFLTLDWTLSLASVEDTGWWNGVPMVGGPVVYVVAEGVAGFGKRIKAWEKQHHEASYFHRIVWLPLAVNLFDAKEAVALAEIVVPLDPVLIVFDTLARCSLGADENSGRDAGRVVDNMDTIRRATGACVLTVHHTGYDQSHARGHTAYKGALDTELSLEDQQGDGRLRLTMPKQKDDRTLPPLWLSRIEVASSCVIVPGEETQEDEAALRKGERETLEVLRSIEIEGGVSSGAWEDSHPNVAKRTFHGRKKRLLRKGLVLNVGRVKLPKYVVAEGA